MDLASVINFTTWFLDLLYVVLANTLSLAFALSLGILHLPRNSENWDVNGTHAFGSFHWTISGINGTSEKVVLFSRWKLSDGKCQYHLLVSQGVFQFQTFHGHIFGKMAAHTSVPSNSLYECPVCHGLAPDLQTLMNVNYVMYANGK